MEWKPIETYEGDAQVLLTYPHEGDPYVTVGWRDHTGAWLDSMAPEHDNWMPAPTHWMPLPEPPK